MYSPPMFDSIIDFTLKDDDAILCKGRGRQTHVERRVPRLPHMAFIIKKQIADQELNAGKRKRGRGRASIFKSRQQQNEALFRPRMPNSLDPGRSPALEESVTTSTQAEINGCFDTFDDYVGVAGYDPRQEDFPVLKGEGFSTSNLDTTSNDSNDRAAKAIKREKERQHQKVNFAEINRQIFSELASTFTNNKAHHKPVRVLSLTRANLDKHMKDSEDVLKISEVIDNARSSVNTDAEAPLYEQFGVTHEDIWLYRQNRLKMPQNIKEKVKKHTESKQVVIKEVDDTNCDVSNELTNVEVKISFNAELEHEKQVNYLTQLYDEDSWSNQKELSVHSIEEKADGDIQTSGIQDVEGVTPVEYNDCGEGSHEECVGGENAETKVDIGNSEDCDHNFDQRNNQIANLIDSEKSSSQCVKGDDGAIPVLYNGCDIVVDIDEKIGVEPDDTEVEYIRNENCDKIIDQSNNAVDMSNDGEFPRPCVIEELGTNNVNFNSLSLNDKFALDDSSFSDDFCFSDDSDINITVRHAENELCLNHEVVNKSFTACGKTSQSIVLKTKGSLESNSDTSASKPTDTQEDSIDITDSDMSNSKDDPFKSKQDIILYSESSDFETDDIPLMEKTNETINIPVLTKQNQPKSTVALLDEIEVHGTNENSVNGAEGNNVGNDLEGFQVVKKKRSKRKSVSPKQNPGKNKVKPDNTIWKLYGKNVIQVDGLPPNYDASSLYSMVCGFGNVIDFQVRNIEGVCSVRFRLPDEDSCVFAVQCLDKTEMFADEDCVLSCCKLSN